MQASCSNRILLLFIGAIGSLLLMACTPITADPTPTEFAERSFEELVQLANSPGYDNLFRNNEQYIDELVSYRAEIVQVVELGSNDYQLRANVTEGRFLWEDTVFLRYSGTRILEEDIIEFVGQVKGLSTYESIFGQRITIPDISVVRLRVISKSGDTVGQAMPSPTAQILPTPRPEVTETPLSNSTTIPIVPITHTPDPTTYSTGASNSESSRVLATPSTSMPALRPTTVPTSIPTPTPTIVPTQTPMPTIPTVGSARENPAPPGQTVMTPDGFALTVVSVNSDAWDIIHEENKFNDPPPPGFRDYLVEVRVENVGGSAIEETRVADSDFSMVGSFAIIYSPFEHGCGVIPNGLDSDLFLGATAQGNVCMQLPTEETDIIMFYEPLFSFEGNTRRWMMADQPDSVQPVVGVSAVPPIDQSARLGTSRSNPAPPGSILLTGSGLSFSVTSITRDAQQIISSENQFNDPPKDGRRFLLLTLEVENIEGGQQEINVSKSDFRIVGSKGQLLTAFAHGCGLIPNELFGSLFEGGKLSGNICFEVDSTEADFQLAFDPFSLDGEARRWLSLGPEAD